MRVARLLIMLVVFILIGICVQENAAHLTSLTIFGLPLFSGVSVPVLILASMLAGALLVLLLLFTGRKRVRRNEESQDHGAK